MGCTFFVKGFMSSKDLEEILACHDHFHRIGLKNRVLFNPDTRVLVIKMRCEEIIDLYKSLETDKCGGLSFVVEGKCWSNNYSDVCSKPIESGNVIVISQSYSCDKKPLKLIILNKNKLILNKDLSLLKEKIRKRFAIDHINVTKLLQSFNIGEIYLACRELIRLFSSNQDYNTDKKSL